MWLDVSIFLIFFIYLIISTYREWGTSNNINNYAIGRRTFTTFSLGATITATFVSGSGFIMDLNHFQKEGWEYLLPSLCMILCFVIIGTIIAPRMERFFGKTSVATIMYEEYGQTVRLITALAGAITVCGGISIQFKILGKVGNHLYPSISWEYWSVLIGIITVFYTILGGIRSVVSTDIIQTICFLIAFSVITSLLYQDYSTLSASNQLSEKTYHFNILSITDLNSARFWNMIWLGLYFLIPAMSPTTVQRISMAVNISQIKKSYLWSSFFILLTILLGCLISYMLFYSNSLEKINDDIISFFLSKFIIPGSKTIVVIGIISMCMSTADSNINIASVLLANDTYKSKTWDSITKLHMARYYGLFIGICSILLSIKDIDILDTILLFRSFYMPLITAPMLALIFGFKTTTRCCLIAMAFAAIYVTIFKFIINPKFNIIPLSIALNGIALISSHYIIEKWEWLKPFGITSQLKKD